MNIPVVTNAIRLDLQTCDTAVTRIHIRILRSFGTEGNDLADNVVGGLLTTQEAERTLERRQYWQVTGDVNATPEEKIKANQEFEQDIQKQAQASELFRWKTIRYIRRVGYEAAQLKLEEAWERIGRTDIPITALSDTEEMAS